MDVATVREEILYQDIFWGMGREQEDRWKALACGQEKPIKTDNTNSMLNLILNPGRDDVAGRRRSWCPLQWRLRQKHIAVLAVQQRELTFEVTDNNLRRILLPESRVSEDEPQPTLRKYVGTYVLQAVLIFLSHPHENIARD